MGSIMGMVAVLAAILGVIAIAKSIKDNKDKPMK